MNEFLEQLAALLEKHGVEISTYADFGYESGLQFFRQEVENPWTDALDFDETLSHEGIREYLKQEKTK